MKSRNQSTRSPSYLALLALAFLPCAGIAADARPADPLPAVPAGWTYGFEASEGYETGRTAGSQIVNVIGGSATIETGGAAQGTQFLRFAPAEADASLVIKLPVPLTAAGRRSIGFSVRLPDTTETTRLVLSFGGTVALRPVVGGVELAMGEGSGPTRSQSLVAGQWLPLTLTEDLATKTWSLRVGSDVIGQDLPMPGAPAAFSDVLLFADGSLDLDALSAASAGPMASGGEGSDGRPAHGQAAYDEVQRNRLIGQALDAARLGDLEFARQVAAALARRVGENEVDPAEEGQLLALMAFALRDGGLHLPASALGRSAIEALSRARDRFTDSRPDRRASFEFLSAQIAEQLLGDWMASEQFYQAALRHDDAHKGAKGGLDRLRSKRAVEERAVSLGIGGGR